MIVPDYLLPSAIMVPHYACNLTPLLETIATQTAKSVGVIVISKDPLFTDAFIATQPDPDRFSVIAAPLDSPWLRDRSPIAIRNGKKIRWYIPRWEYDERPNDTFLFERICASIHPTAPIDYMPQGNLVAGAQGLAFTTRDMLKKNKLTQEKLNQHGSTLGIKHWLTFNGFRQEQTGHADIHVRVLAPKLFAIAWNLSSKQDRHNAERLLAIILNTVPQARVIKVPIRSKGKLYASLLNWLQLGKRLLIPRFDLTPEHDIIETRALLTQHGFKTEFIYSPTLDVHGSLHCLTASIYV